MLRQRFSSCVFQEWELSYIISNSSEVDKTLLRVKQFITQKRYRKLGCNVRPLLSLEMYMYYKTQIKLLTTLMSDDYK